jgi:hypothetical protein
MRLTPKTITPAFPPRTTLVITATLPATLSIFWNGQPGALAGVGAVCLRDR